MRRTPVFVVPVEPSPDMEATVSAAVALGRRHGAEVHLLEVFPPRRSSRLDGEGGMSPRRGVSDGRVGSRLQQLTQTKGRTSVPVRTVAYPGDPTVVIPSYTQLVKADLIVVSQHFGTPRWRRNPRIVGTFSRAAPAPVLVLPPGVSAAVTARAFDPIVSAVDFTVASAVALRTTINLIRRTGARLTLVHALQSFPGHMVFSGGEAVGAAKNLHGHAAHVAGRLRQRMPADVRMRIDTRVTTGGPDRGILEVASDVKANLIVMGVPPRSRFDEVLFGSTLRGVLRRTTIAVLVLSVPAGAYKWLEVDVGKGRAKSD